MRLPRFVERRSSEVSIGDLTLVVESLEPIHRSPRAAGARDVTVELIDGPGAGRRENLAGAGVARLPTSIEVARRLDGSVDRLGAYQLERLEGGVGHYRWSARPAPADERSD